MNSNDRRIDGQVRQRDRYTYIQVLYIYYYIHIHYTQLYTLVLLLTDRVVLQQVEHGGCVHVHVRLQLHLSHDLFRRPVLGKQLGLPYCRPAFLIGIAPGVAASTIYIGL